MPSEDGRSCKVGEATRIRILFTTRRLAARVGDYNINIPDMRSGGGAAPPERWTENEVNSHAAAQDPPSNEG